MSEDSATNNSFAGIARHVLQARDLYGDVHIHGTADGPSRQPLFMIPAETEYVVARPELLEQVVERLIVAEAAPVVAMTGISGAGGFGKTTLAAQVCRDPRVMARFGDVLWLTIGENVEGADLAAKINDLAAHLTDTRPSYVDPQQAGHFLNSLLRDRPDYSSLMTSGAAASLPPFWLTETSVYVW